MTDMAMTFPILSKYRLCNRRRWIGANAIGTAGTRRLTLMRELLAIRRREIVPRLQGAHFGAAKVADSGLVTARWRMGGGTMLSLIANLSDHDLAALPCGQRNSASGAAR